jgi:hypothetical protein
MKRKVLMLSTVGIAAGLLYALESNRRKQAASRGVTGNDSGTLTEGAASMATIENGKAAVPQSEDQHPIDDQGTTQAEASHILKEIRDSAFDASNERLALALGRSTEEIEQWTSGDSLIDGDALMKARALAIQRDVEVG